MSIHRLSAPLTDEAIEKLQAGDRALISGTVYTARDAAHKKLVELLEQGEPLPVDLQGQIIYYVGPTPTKPGEIIGAAGPTTSGRMDSYTPQMLQVGVKAFIGKGARSQEVREALQAHKGVYLAAVGGAAALIKESITACDVIAYKELGPEAMRKLEVEDFPVVVVNDIYGNDLYEQGVEAYKSKGV